MIQNLELKEEKHTSLADVVFHNLRWAILKGDLAPGERLIEMFLADRFKVSRTTVREAIRKLELEGLALTVPGRGAKVAKIEEKDLKDVLEVRSFLEAIAIDLACERITIELLVKLEMILEKFHRAIDSREIIKIAESDKCFHKLIVETTGNFQLIQVMDDLERHMYRYRFEYIRRSSNYTRLYKVYSGIYEAIKKQDKKLAQERMNDYISYQEQVLVGTCNTTRFYSYFSPPRET